MVYILTDAKSIYQWVALYGGGDNGYTWSQK